MPIKLYRMVAFAFAIALALLATTTSAVPTELAARQGPPTSSAIDFTLYKTIAPGKEDQCWTSVDIIHVAPTDVGRCNTADFYVAHIDTVASGWNCFLNVYEDAGCMIPAGGYYDGTPCGFPTLGNSNPGAVDLHSWSVACLLPPGSE